jgi:hypothetical protein
VAIEVIKEAAKNFITHTVSKCIPPEHEQISEKIFKNTCFQVLLS